MTIRYHRVLNQTIDWTISTSRQLLLRIGGVWIKCIWIKLKCRHAGEEGQTSLDRWNQDELAPEWFKDKSMDKKRNDSWCHIICQTWWKQHYCMTTDGCHWNQILVIIEAWLLIVGWKCTGLQSLLRFRQRTQSMCQKWPKSFSRLRNGTFYNGQVSQLISKEHAF